MWQKFYPILWVTILLLTPCWCPLSVHAQDQEKIEKYINMSLQELMEVEITTASKMTEKISDIPASVVLITRDDIETHGYLDLGEILENIPGLYAIDNYSEGGKNFGVRGFWSANTNDNMIILVDNVSQVDDSGSYSPLPQISVPIEAIDRIEVIRGPMSVIYGNGAFYGVVNIITNNTGPGNKSTNILSGSIGTQKTGKVFLRLADNKEDFSYTLNASWYDSYGIDQNLDQMMGAPSMLTPSTTTTGGKLENNEKYFNFSGTLKNFYLNLSYNETEKEFYFGFPSQPPGSISRINNHHLSLGYRESLSEFISIDGKLSYASNRMRIKYNVLFQDFYGIQELESNALEIEANVFITPTSNLNIATGLYYRTILDAANSFDLPSFNNSNLENTHIFLSSGDNIVTRSIYSQIQYTPLEKLRLVAGLRLEQSPAYQIEKTQTNQTTTIHQYGRYDKDNIEMIPRFAAIYYINQKNVLKLLYGKAINRPSFEQNRINIFAPDLPILEPEVIDTVELNYIASLAPQFNLNVSFFSNTLNNLITRIVENDLNDEYRTWSGNAGKMVTHGLEITMNSHPFKNFALEVSGTFQKTTDKRQGYEHITVAYSPQTLGYLKASYRFNKNMTIGLTGNYVGSMETYWDETSLNSDNSHGKRIGKKAPGYFVCNANLRFENVGFNRLYLNMRCSNLFNADIRYPTTTINQWLDQGTLGIKRSFRISAGWKF